MASANRCNPTQQETPELRMFTGIGNECPQSQEPAGFRTASLKPGARIVSPGRDFWADIRANASALNHSGWARLPGVIPAMAADSLRPPTGLHWRKMAPQVGRVRQGGWYGQPAHEELPSSVLSFSERLAVVLAEVVDGLDTTFRFNEVTWQRHIPQDLGVAPHRDQSFYDGVVAIATLAGQARFAILAVRDPEAIVAAWQTGPGDLTLLAGGASPHPRPWHTVGGSSTPERLTLTFRHTQREPGGWD